MENRKIANPDSLMQRIAPYSAEVLDPFVLNRTLPFAQKIKSIILSFTLLPVRILLMFTLLLIAWVIGKAGRIGLPEEEKSCRKPLSGWRRDYLKPLLVRLARLVFAVGGWNWIPQKGTRASAREAPILLLVPHTSFWDTVPCIALGCPCLIVKDSTETVPLFGDLMNYTQPVYVKRDDPHSRQKTIDEILRRCRSQDDWEQILIFPEGTCSNRQALLEFKLGAFYPGVPIQPVFIRYKNRLDSITWSWSGPGAWEQIWLTLTQFHIFCELEFLPVYYPTGVERENPKIYAENLRLSISRACNIPISYFSLEDVRFLNTAKSLRLPKTVALVKLLKLRYKTGNFKLDVREEQAALKKRLESLSDPLCDVNQFAKYIDAKVCDAVRDFFNLLDQAKQGRIDARTYNIGLWLLRTDVTEWKRLESCFKEFDAKGVITENQFAAIALLWRGLPLKVSLDIFCIFDSESKRKGTINFDTFKSVATSYIHLENSSTRNTETKSTVLSNGKTYKTLSEKIVNTWRQLSV